MAAQGPPPESAPEPVPIFLVTPADSFLYSLQQMAALNALGYPVEIARLNRQQAYDMASRAFSGSDVIEAEKKESRRIAQSYIDEEAARHHSDAWYQPMLLDTDFYGWANDPEDALNDLADAGNLSPEIRQGALDHPGYILSHRVSRGSFRAVARYIDLTKDKSLPMVKPGIYSPSIRGCYMRALDRYLEMDPKDRMADYQGDNAPVRGSEIVRHNYYKKELGTKPVSVRALGALVRDYYLYLEQNVPEFAAFKRPARQAG